MRKLIFLLLLAFLSSFILRKELAGDCPRLYEEILKAYKRFEGDKGYLKYSTTTNVNGKKSGTLVTEIWKNGKKVKYSNPLMEVYQDSLSQVLIMKDTRQVFVRRVDPDEVQSASSPPFHKDSLNRFAEKVDCGKVGNREFFSMTVKEKYLESTGLTRIYLEYEKSSGKLVKGVYDYAGIEKRQEEYDYLAYDASYISQPFKGTATGMVLSGGKLKEEYKNYSLRDLR